MRWVQSEYALKGLFLALLFYTALQIQILPAPAEGQVRSADDELRLAWEKTGTIALYMLGGLAVGIILGLLRQIKDLSRILVKPHAFFLFLLLENPLLIYLGLIGGLGLGGVSRIRSASGGPAKSHADGLRWAGFRSWIRETSRDCELKSPHDVGRRRRGLCHLFRQSLLGEV